MGHSQYRFYKVTTIKRVRGKYISASSIHMSIDPRDAIVVRVHKEN